MKKNLVLTGMMGVGKSTIGKKLAQRLKRKFVDVDKIIEIKEKNTIKEIFENKEQIEVSKFYERLPKPHAIAIQEWLDDKVYHRDSKEEIEE